MSDHIYNQDFGFLPSKAARLADVLHDYNPYISLVFIPPRERSESDVFPYGLLDSSPWREPYIIRHLTEQELEQPAEVLAWLFEGDLSKHRTVDIMAKQKIRADAEKLMNMKAEEDAAAERQELAAALMVGGRDRKHYYRHNGTTFGG